MRALQRSLIGPVACGALAFLVAFGVRAEPVTITVLHTNDVYEISPKDGQGGLAELMTLLKRERAAAEHSITTFGGDLISPSVLSGLTQGTQMVDLYNQLGTDIAVLGNHDFDFGPEILADESRPRPSPGSAPTCSGRTASPRSARSRPG